MGNEYTVQNYFNFLVNGRFDKLSPVGLEMIFDEIERLKLVEKESIENKKPFKELKNKNFAYSRDITKFVNDFKVNVISIVGTSSDGFVLYYKD